MISKFTALSAFVGLMFFSVPAAAQDHGHEDAHHEETQHGDTHSEEAHAVELHAEEAHDDNHEAHSEGHGHGAFVPASDTEGRKAVVKETVEHHLADSYEFHIVGPVGFPLPVILFDNGLKVFSSAKFHHGESVAEVDGSYYGALFRGKGGAVGRACLARGSLGRDGRAGAGWGCDRV